jgi:hypothetical protein
VPTLAHPLYEPFMAATIIGAALGVLTGYMVRWIVR